MGINRTLGPPNGTCAASQAAATAVSQKLALEDISCNVVAAYFHDHIFVSTEKADLAVASLRQLQADSEAAAQA